MSSVVESLYSRGKSSLIEGTVIYKGETSDYEISNIDAFMNHDRLYILADTNGCHLMKKYFNSILDVPSDDIGNENYFVISKDFPQANEIARDIMTIKNL